MCCFTFVGVKPQSVTQRRSIAGARSVTPDSERVRQRTTHRMPVHGWGLGLHRKHGDAWCQCVSVHSIHENHFGALRSWCVCVCVCVCAGAPCLNLGWELRLSQVPLSAGFGCLGNSRRRIFTGFRVHSPDTQQVITRIT